MRSNKSYVKETLAFVNKLRKQYNAALLDDIRPGEKNGRECPISRSLCDVLWDPYTSCGDDIYYGSYEIKRYRIPQTRAVRRFVRAFDTGKLPEYHI